MLLPIPVLLFDSRVTVEVRGANVLTMVLGMLGIKFAVSNGLESLVMSRSAILSGNLDEEQPGAETHPVLILFAVVLCGQIWGVTGMLISVPLLSLVRLLLNLEAMKQHRAMADAQQRRLSYIGEFTGRLPKHLLRMPKDLTSGAFYSHSLGERSVLQGMWGKYDHHRVSEMPISQDPLEV
eukprot:g29427.t1